MTRKGNYLLFTRQSRGSCEMRLVTSIHTVMNATSHSVSKVITSQNHLLFVLSGIQPFVSTCQMLQFTIPWFGFHLEIYHPEIYLLLAVLNLRKPQTCRFLFVIYALIWYVVDESDSFETELINMTSTGTQKNLHIISKSLYFRSLFSLLYCVHIYYSLRGARVNMYIQFVLVLYVSLTTKFSCRLLVPWQ